MSKVLNDWSWWQNALAGGAPDIHPDTPHPGFYKMRDGKDGTWLPVMIRFDDEGTLRCRVGDNSGSDPQQVWTYCAGRPISKEDAKVAFETGRFPGEVELAKIGDNSGDVTLAEQIADYASQALAWLKKTGIVDTKTKDRAANYRSELLRLRKEADALRETEKRPHLDASRAVDMKFKPLIEDADKAANTLRDALTVYMREEERKLEDERRAKWEAEQRAAAEARKAVEEQRAKQMADDPIAALTSPEPELPMAPPPPEPVKVQAGGQRGRKTGLREVTIYTVTDHAKALAYFSEHEDVKAVVQKLAERVAKTGIEVPGVKVSTDKVAA